jgi:hypothetical protein
MAAAHVNSVNVFAKCAHGFSYHPTSVGTVHPGLRRDLLGAQIAALRARGIKAPAYVSVLWDDLAAVRHPEWVAVDESGRLLARAAFSNASGLEHAVGWNTLDLASGYADYVAAQIEEVCELYQPDGFWLDIVSVLPNYSPAGMERMKRSGVDVSDPAARTDFYLNVRDAFVRRIGRLVHARLPEASLVFNHTTDAWVGRTLPAQNQIDVESLPTDGNWGYLHYPVVARFARTFGPPVVGMTARFHRSWSDFGGVKTPDQMLYEVATVLSAGGSPSIGDQMDPSGRLDPAVYGVIGQALARAEALEPWLAGTRPLAEAAIVAAWEQVPADAGRVTKTLTAGVSGAAQMLLEQAVQFDIVDAGDLVPGRYRLLVAPDDVRLSPQDAAAIERCLEAGAALLTAGDRLTGDLPGSPVETAQPTATRPAYFRPETVATPESGLTPDFAYASYGQAFALTAAPGAQTAGQVVEARFNRTWEHLTGHVYAPVGQTVAGPLVATAGSWAHLATPVFSDYFREGYWTGAALVAALIDQLAPDRLVRHDGPPWVEVTLHSAPELPGLVLHSTAYQPRRAAGAVPRVDRSHPIAGFAINVRTDGTVSRAFIAPSGDPVPFVTSPDGSVELRPSTLEPHTVIVLEYASWSTEAASPTV